MMKFLASKSETVLKATSLTVQTGIAVWMKHSYLKDTHASQKTPVSQIKGKDQEESSPKP